MGSLLAVLALTLRPRTDGPVAVLFPPWWDAAHAIEAAAQAGGVVRMGAFPFVVIVSSPAGQVSDELYRAGAWLLLDPVAVGGCADPNFAESLS